MRREIRRAGLVDGRAIGLVIKFAQILLEIDQHLAARRGRGTPVGAETCRRQTKKHMKGKDQPKGAGKHTSFRTRAPFNREARIAQAMNDEGGMCNGKCFKFVPFVPSSDPVPGHTARGEIDRLKDLHDPIPRRQAVQNSNDPVPGRRTAHHVFDPVPGRQTMKDDLVPGHPG